MAMMGVYDGHGGRDIVDFLEDALSYNIAQELRPDDSADDADIPTRLERAFLLTDVQSRMAGLMTSGATVAICLIKKHSGTNKVTIYAANVGDARAVVSSTDAGNPAFRLTHDHRADDPSEVARIEAAGGFLFKNRVLGILAVARSLGDHGLKEYVIGRPYVSTTEVRLGGPESTESSGVTAPSEFVIIACDGLWDVMEDQEAVDMVRKFGRASCDNNDAAKILVDEAIRRGSMDNVTAIVVYI